MRTYIIYTFSFIISLVTVCHLSLGQNTFNESSISIEVNEIIDNLSHEGTLYLVDCRSDMSSRGEYDYYKLLEDQASIPELLELVKHPKRNIRCYSFLILSQIDSLDLLPIVIDQFNDTACIDVINSCVLRAGYYPCYNVSDFFIETITKGLYPGTVKLGNTQLAFVDSLLIYSPEKKRSRYYALKRQRAEANRYDRIKEIYYAEDSYMALVALAKFQKQEDISLILNAGSKFKQRYVFEAISHFPDPAFVPLLIETLDVFRFNSRSEHYFYLALASYKNKQSKELLYIAFEKLLEEDNNSYRLDDLLNALQSHIDTVYTDLMYQLWERAYITPDICRFLMKLDANKALDYSKASLKDTVKLNQYLGGVYDKKTDTLLHLILGNIVELDRPFGIEVITAHTEDAHVLMFPAFAKYASVLKEEVFIEPLLNVVMHNTYERNCRAAVESLIAYERADINQKLIEIRNMRSGTQEGTEINQVLIEQKIDFITKKKRP